MSRIAILTTSYPRSPGDPAGHFVEAEARLLARDGHSVTVLAPGFPGRRTSPSRERGVDVQWLPGGAAFGSPGALFRIRERPLRAFSALEFVRAARRALTEMSGTDRVIAHWMVPCAWPAATRGAAPLDVVVHGSDARLLLAVPRAPRTAVVSRLLDRGATFRFVSTELRDTLAANTTSRLLARSRVEPCAVDVTEAPTRDGARHSLGIPEHRRVAVVVGRLVASKDPVSAVKLAAASADHVVVIGDGPLAPRLAKLRPSPTLLGALPRAQTLAWIAAADLLVSASRAEGAPTVIREARALGTPVVALPVGDLRAWAAKDPGIRLVEPSLR